MISSDARVYIIDDDPHIQEALGLLFKSVGLKASTFSSADEFLETDLPDEPSCIILDIRLPRVSGLDLQQRLLEKACQIPIIFITGHGTVPMSVRAMKSGAVDFLQKPFEDQDLLDATNKAIAMHREARSRQAAISRIKKAVASLSHREHEVFVYVVAGLQNKQIAYELNLSENTIKSHRATIMKKMGAESLADLVRFAEKLDIVPPK